MKVRELIERLQESDPEARVYCPVIAEGFDEVLVAYRCEQEVTFYDNTKGKIFTISSEKNREINLKTLSGFDLDCNKE